MLSICKSFDFFYYLTPFLYGRFVFNDIFVEQNVELAQHITQ